jgi:hypothetical protein
MTNIEQVRQPQPDEHHTEPRLPKPELAQHAHQHINDYIKAIKNTPEFIQEFPNAFFDRMTMIEGDEFRAYPTMPSIENEVAYERGGNKFGVEYDSTNKRRSLYVLRDYRKTGVLQGESDALMYESVSVNVFLDHKHPHNGRFSHKKVYNDGRIELHVDTPTASQRIKDFRTTNFPPQQTQTPPATVVFHLLTNPAQ